ncbi:hypothetical protein OIU74_000921 [Salix koriyanagi]|uniref:Uncharacterized protein n=1 Tax=Salix koriyanagi TaxID=2511006 RepID=A0A9Q0X2J5_9ROSI|nr:hypothetical protein OIU74_000921 [Salix koriyanagi]
MLFHKIKAYFSTLLRICPCKFPEQGYRKTYEKLHICHRNNILKKSLTNYI